MKTKIFITILAALFLWSCSSEEPIMQTSQSTEMSIMPSGRYLSPEEACEIACHSLVSMDLVPASRGERTAKTYLYNPYNRSRNAESDTLLYVVNFDEGGFALILADRAATNHTIAISATGCYENNVNPSSEAYLLAMLPPHPTIPVIPPTPLPIEPGNPNPWAYDDDGYQVGVYEDTYTYEHFLNVAWEQCYPYNLYCTPLSKQDKDYTIANKMEYQYMGHGLVGCLPLAIGQICTYYKKPQQLAGRILHWEDMTAKSTYYGLNSIGRDNVCFLLSYIGYSIGLEHGLISEIDTNESTVALKNLGYSDVSKESNINKCFEALTKNEIVYMRGTSDKGGHGWVVDGYKKIVKTWRRFEKGSSTVSHEIRREETNYLTFNWGWGSNDHVYYLAGSPYEVDDYLVFDRDFFYVVNIR